MHSTLMNIFQLHTRIEYLLPRNKSMSEVGILALETPQGLPQKFIPYMSHRAYFRCIKIISTNES